jgi:hypothetical protein
MILLNGATKHHDSHEKCEAKPVISNIGPRLAANNAAFGNGLFLCIPLPLAGGVGGGHVMQMCRIDSPSPNPSRKREGNK